MIRCVRLERSAPSAERSREFGSRERPRDRESDSTQRLDLDISFVDSTVIHKRGLLLDAAF